jgi:hypothetical protein
LNRQKAAEIFSELSKTGIIDPKKNSIMLMSQDCGGIHSKGKQLHVKTTLNLASRIWLQAVMDEHQLKYKEQPDKIVIIDPV